MVWTLNYDIIIIISWELRGLVILLFTRFYCRSILVRRVGETCLCGATGWCVQRPKTVFWTTLILFIYTLATTTNFMNFLTVQFSSGTEIFYFLFCCWQRHKSHLRAPDTRPTEPRWWSKNRAEHSPVSGSFHLLTLMRGGQSKRNLTGTSSPIQLGLTSTCSLEYMSTSSSSSSCKCNVIYLHSFHIGHQPGRWINYMN